MKLDKKDHSDVDTAGKVLKIGLGVGGALLGKKLVKKINDCLLALKKNGKNKPS